LRNDAFYFQADTLRINHDCRLWIGLRPLAIVAIAYAAIATFISTTKFQLLRNFKSIVDFYPKIEKKRPKFTTISVVFQSRKNSVCIKNNKIVINNWQIFHAL